MANDQMTGVSVTVAAAAPGPGAAAAARSTGFSFRELLSDLNPLQYIPGVGAIYRAITGDEGNKDLRFVASLGTSFALGGPVGVGITVAERVTGIDPERIGRHLLSGLFHSGKPSPAPTAFPANVPSAAGSIPGAARPWTAEELTAYGVKGTGDGELTAGKLSSADVLNTLELRRLANGYA